jgi:hypothetical protein
MAPFQGEPASSVHLPFGSFPAALSPLQLLDPSPTMSRSNSHLVTPQYSLAYRRFKVGTMTPTNQIHFLYFIVKDVLCLGRSSSDHVLKPSPVSMTIGERELYLAAQYYKKGKRFIPIKTVFCRVVDPFFECLYTCCRGDIAEFQQKYPDFKASHFKKEKKDNKCACSGRLQKPGG